MLASQPVAFAAMSPLALRGVQHTPRAPSTPAATSSRTAAHSAHGRASAAPAGQTWLEAAVAPGAALATLGLAARRASRQRGATRQRTTRHAFFGIGAPDKKTVIITGASSGLGLSTTKELARSGEWCVIMACRDFQKAEKVAKEAELPKGSYMVLHLDLGSLNSVRQFVNTFRTLGRPLDALVCNAAVYFPNAHKSGAFLPGLFPGGGPRFSADGIEQSFATNYLGHFLLCNLMMDDLKNSYVKPARCVILGTVTASINDKELGGKIPPLANIGNLEGLEEGMKLPVTMLDGGEFNGAKAYKDSKVCDVMLMKELHRRFHDSTGIVFSSLYPGCIAETGLFREHYPVFQFLFPVLQKSVTNAYVSEDEAGQRLAKCVADPAYTTSGAYYTWGGSSGTGGSGGKDAVENTEKTSDIFVNYGSFRTLKPEEIGGEAANNERCVKLWDLSEKLVKSMES